MNGPVVSLQDGALALGAPVYHVDFDGDAPPPGWTVETGSWTPSPAGLLGHVDGDRAAVLWCDAAFPFDLAVRVRAAGVAPSDNDANFFFRAAGTIYGDGEQTAWIAGTAGWYQHDHGLERHPDGPTRRVPGEPLPFDRPVDVVAGYRDGSVFLWKDGALLLEHADPAPLPADRYPRAGLGTWDATVRFLSFSVYRIDA